MFRAEEYSKANAMLSQGEDRDLQADQRGRAGLPDQAGHGQRASKNAPGLHPQNRRYQDEGTRAGGRIGLLQAIWREGG